MIIVGLGNPGKEYEGTRHNIGFVVLDVLSREIGHAPWKFDHGVLYTRFGNHWLIKPQEFMNVSGQTLQHFLTYKNIPSDPAALAADLLVVHDEVDFPELGRVQPDRDRSSAGHNGVQSIIDALGTQRFDRIRIGVGNNREAGIPAEDFVLQRFNREEQTVMDRAVQTTVDLLKQKLGV